MPNEADLGSRIVNLKAEVAKAQQMRATCEANLTVAKQRLAEVDKQLKDLGLNPENCDVELSALETQLAALVEDLSTKVAAEIKSYNEIVAATRQAFQQ